MRPQGVPSISFHKLNDKQKAPWYSINYGERTFSPRTKLRIFADRLAVMNPRKATETQDQYSERLSQILCGRGLSHLGYLDTVQEVDKWLWGALHRKQTTKFDDDEVPRL